MPEDRRYTDRRRSFGGGASLVVSDSFNRANSATTLGTSDSGHVWTPRNGTWGIASNQAREHGGSSDSFATVDAEVANARVSVEVPTTGNVGLYFRATDTANYLRFVAAAGSLFLQKKVANAMTTLASDTGTVSNGDLIEALFVGSDLTILINGIPVLDATDAAHSTVTNHGIGGEADIRTARFDNFAIRAA